MLGDQFARRAPLLLVFVELPQPGGGGHVEAAEGGDAGVVVDDRPRPADPARNPVRLVHDDQGPPRKAGGVGPFQVPSPRMILLGDKVTVYATYASLGLGTLERAHAAGLSGWDLIVVDEAHRVSGRIGKPWAVVHDNLRIPSLRRLYMTATPRLWQLGEEDEAGAPGELVASMDDDPEGPFAAGRSL
ncbi:hypothetical protein [Streptomyces sp. AMCC400023]|uniref:hypothetical protein n=1 Tax=Streptomyces sp. AMCC400023 TaxID=2056258 RepID=UPI003FA75DD2